MRPYSLWILFIAASLPLYLNDLFYIYMPLDAIGWIIVDYGSRLLVFGALIVFVAKGLIGRNDLALSWLPLDSLIGWTLLLSAVGIAIDHYTSSALRMLFHNSALASYPDFSKLGAFKPIDLTLGLFMTALSEELLFRGLLLTLLQRTLSPMSAIVISTLLFGLIHWCYGPSSILSAALWGLLPALIVIRTHSLWPAIIAHYLTDLVDFW